MKKKNEKTSKAVASAAGALLKNIDAEIAALRQLQGQLIIAIDGAVTTLHQAKSVVASALTQAADKKRI